MTVYEYIGVKYLLRRGQDTNGHQNGHNTRTDFVREFSVRFTVSRCGMYARDFTMSELAAINTGDAGSRMPPFALLFTAK